MPPSVCRQCQHWTKKNNGEYVQCGNKASCKNGKSLNFCYRHLGDEVNLVKKTTIPPIVTKIRPKITEKILKQPIPKSSPILETKHKTIPKPKTKEEIDRDKTMTFFEETLALSDKYQSHHSHVDLLLLYMKQLSDELKYVCIPFHNEGDKYKIPGYMGCTLKKNGDSDVHISWGTANAMAKCLRDTNIKFICILLIIDSKGQKGNIRRDINMLIIDNSNKEIERFEPIDLADNDSSRVDEAMNKFFEETLSFSKTEDKAFMGGPYEPTFLGKNRNRIYLKYIGPLEFCPTKFQFKEKNNLHDYCGAWSIFYFHVRILNPELNRKQVIALCLEMINAKADNKFFHFIQQYSLRMAGMLKALDSNLFREYETGKIQPFEIQKKQMVDISQLVPPTEQEQEHYNCSLM